METIKPFKNVNAMRALASERIHATFGNVPFIYVKYRDNYAEGYCQYKDGLIAGFTVWYRDMLVQVEEYTLIVGQHERAMRYINSMPQDSWAS